MTNELIQKAKECKSADELLAFAKENGIEMTAEVAGQLIDLQKGNLSDEDLNKVIGGYLPNYASNCRYFTPTNRNVVERNCKECFFCEGLPGERYCSKKNCLIRYEFDD